MRKHFIGFILFGGTAIVLIASCRPAEAPPVPLQPAVSSPVVPATPQSNVVGPSSTVSVTGSVSSPLNSLPTATPSAVIVPPNEPTAIPEFVPSPGGASGVQFTATFGPTCPGPQRPGEVCTRPYQGVLKVTTPDGAEVAQVRTNENGQATLSLPPGEYMAGPVLDPNRPFPRGVPVTFTVNARQYTNVAIQLDTGIR